MKLSKFKVDYRVSIHHTVVRSGFNNVRCINRSINQQELFSSRLLKLVNLHGAVYRAHEKEAGIEADGTREHEKSVREDEHVAKVKDSADGLADVQLGEKIEGPVGEQVQGAGAAR